MADYLLVQGTDPVTGAPTFDRSISPNGDWALVSGVQLLAQNVLLFLLTPLGTHPTDPSFGTTLSADIGQPLADSSVYALALAECAAYFQALQVLQPTPLNEQLASIDAVTIGTDPTNANRLLISFVVHAASGDSTVATLNQ